MLKSSLNANARANRFSRLLNSLMLKYEGLKQKAEIGFSRLLNSLMLKLTIKNSLSKIGFSRLLNSLMLK